MIEVKNLTKKYGSKVALKDVTFSVERGEILGFLGLNGAGKTTTMNIITGYLSSDSGTVTIDGKEIFEEPIEVKSKIGYLPEMPPLYQDMTVKAYLRFVCDLKKIKLPKEEHILGICQRVRIDHVAERVIKNLSKGYRQRIGLAQALIGNPDLLILDEPTVGLDPNQIIEIRSLIKELGEKHTIILSSHVLSEIQAVCSRVVIIHDGTVVADDTAENLSSNLSDDNELLLSVEGDKDAINSAIASIDGITKVSIRSESLPGVWDYTIEVLRGRDVRRDIFRQLAKLDFPILYMNNKSLTLEDVFIRVTSRAVGESVFVQNQEDDQTNGGDE